MADEPGMPTTKYDLGAGDFKRLTLQSKSALAGLINRGWCASLFEMIVTLLIALSRQAGGTKKLASVTPAFYAFSLLAIWLRGF